VRDYKSLESAVATCVSELGQIDFVICGAAGNFLSTVEGLSANAFRSVVEIDLIGSFNTVKACLGELKKSKGKIIFVSAAFHYTGAALQSHVSVCFSSHLSVHYLSLCPLFCRRLLEHPAFQSNCANILFHQYRRQRLALMPSPTPWLLNWVHTVSHPTS